MFTIIKQKNPNDAFGINDCGWSYGRCWSEIEEKPYEPIFDYGIWEETETAKVYEIELPRYSKDQVNIELSEGYFYIAADNGKNKFGTAVSLPTNVDLNVTAKLENGVLTISFPKKQKTSTKIKID